MGVGDLLGKLKGKDKEEPKKFLALLLTDEVVQAAVWRVMDGVTETVALGTPVEWDGETGTTTELITAVDATISSATEGEAGEINEVILGIPFGWTDKNGVLGSKREFIKSINKELELKPLGYVAITDSVLTYLKMQEGTPATSILIAVSRDELTIVLVRLGRVENIEVIGRSNDVVTDVVEGIARFKVTDNLPSRIILFNNMHNLDEITQSLLAVDWQDQFKFLHLPKIEALPKDVAIRALAVAGGSEVAKSLGFAVSEPVPKVEEESVESQVESEVELVSAREIGFGAEEKPEEQEVVANTPSPQWQMPKLAMPKLKLPKLVLPTIHWPERKGWIVAVGVVVGVIGVIGVAVWSVPGAVIQVRVTPKMLDQEVDLTLSTQEANVNVATGVVPAQLETVKASGEKMIDTTGKKTVGEQAKGEVTIYNRTSLTKIFNKGTVLTAPAGIKFSLDSDVTVASKSAGADYVDVPGKSTVNVTANAIGSESNLAGNTELTIGSFGKDSYVAKNDAAMTGGTSQEVRVVAKDDQKLILQQLKAELQTQMEQEASIPQAGEAIYLIPSSIEVESETYTAKVGEEANTIGLTLTTTASLLRYQTREVTELINASIAAAIPAGFVRAELPTQVELVAEAVDDNRETVSGRAKVKIALLPEWDQDKIVKQLRGKSQGEVRRIIDNAIVGTTEVALTLTPKWLPPRITRLPLNANKIRIVLVPTSP